MRRKSSSIRRLARLACPCAPPSPSSLQVLGRGQSPPHFRTERKLSHEISEWNATSARTLQAHSPGALASASARSPLAPAPSAGTAVRTFPSRSVRVAITRPPFRRRLHRCAETRATRSLPNIFSPPPAHPPSSPPKIHPEWNSPVPACYQTSVKHASRCIRP